MLTEAPLTTQKSTSINSHVHPWLTHFAYPLVCRLVVPSYFGRLVVTGQENIPLQGPVIVAPTHSSRWDALIVPYTVGRLVSGRDLRFMVSANEMKGLQGWLIERLGGFPVNTSRPGMGSLVHSVELLSEGEMVVIFPEGGIYRDNKVHALKPGIARIALDVEATQPGSGIKILPLSINYSQPYPKWGCDVTVKIGSAINVADYNKGSMRAETVKLTKELMRRLQELHDEVPKSVTLMAGSSIV